MIKKKFDQEEDKFISNAFLYLFIYSFKDFRYVETFQKALSLPSAGFEKKISSSIKRERSFVRFKETRWLLIPVPKYNQWLGRVAREIVPRLSHCRFHFFFLSSFLILFLFLTGRRVLDHVVSEIWLSSRDIFGNPIYLLSVDCWFLYNLLLFCFGFL